MKLYFYIDYLASPGERLALNILNSDEGEVRTTVRMQPADNAHWTCSIDTEGESYIDYFYSVIDRKAKIVRREWMTIRHRLELSCLKAQRYTIYDHWIDIPENSYLYSSAFTECLHHHEALSRKQTSFAQTVRLKVRAPQLRSYQRLCVMGAGNLLGEWQPQRAVEMTEHNYHEWIVELDTKTLQEPRLEFKFVVMDKGIPMWESGDNRTITLPPMKDGDVVVYELPEVHFLLGDERVAGTLVPVFSLRTKGSFGIGDFGDLKTMIDWMAATGQRILQVLPVNDTTLTHTWTDSYPYSCISVFAFHPQYADLRQLPPLTDNGARERFAALQEELNALPQIDYERVNKAKTEYLYISYVHEGERTMQTDAFRQFFDEEKQWLIPYAVYCSLRDRYHTADFTCWPDHQSWNERERKQYAFPNGKKWKDVAFYYYVQFVLNTQMRAVHDYARERGIILKGDIPIGVNRFSCDVWQEPHYFNTDQQAGAPPDFFSSNGQNWGFPTYNWEEMLKDDCAWWTRRFRHMQKFFDAYRIDHVLGFFRIWEIPAHAVHGVIGHFAPALGMTREEIERYGLYWQEELLTEPFITDWVLDRLFGELASTVRDNYLTPTSDGRYRMKEAFDTQRKVERAFAGKTSDTERRLRDGLYALISDVLFVRDHRDPKKFHPRISVHGDFIYESLWDDDKAAFNRLYHDYFYQRNDQFWYQESMKKLPKLVQSTRMLVCAEDLGMVPECVAWVMDQLRILSLEIQAMPKDARDRFGDLARNPYRSVCTISSHDMPTLRQWWEEDWERAQTYFNTMLFRQGPAPHPLPGWLASDIILRNLMSPSMLCIIAIQDWLAIDEQLRLKDDSHERINEPANPKHYWRYRMHLNIEELLENQEYKEQVSDLIIQSGRHITNQ